MKAILALALFPVLAHAQVNLAGVPQNCDAPLAHDMEMQAIPQILQLGDGAAHITKIDKLGGTPAYLYTLGKYRIDCYLVVHWSNGTVDRGYKLSLWEDRYGSISGSYGPGL